MNERKYYDIITPENLQLFAHTNAELIKGEIRGVCTRFHGYGGSDTHLPQDDFDRYFAKRGILTVYPYYGPWAWASDTTLAFIDRVIEVLCELHGLDGDTPLVIHGQSMGGMTSLTYTHHVGKNGSPLRLCGCAADCPVTDLITLPYTRRDIYSSLVCAYGHYDCELEEAISSASPAAHIADMPRIPYYIVQGVEDGSVDPLTQAQVYVPALKGEGHEVIYKYIPGMQHCSLSPEELLCYYEFIVGAIERRA